MLKAGKKAQAYYEGKADAVNEEAIKAFEDHKVKVVTLSDADYQAGSKWRRRAPTPTSPRTCRTARS